MWVHKKSRREIEVAILVRCLVCQILFKMFLSIRHRNFMIWSTEHRAGQIYFSIFFSIGQCVISHR
jgi:hypothetical protein